MIWLITHMGVIHSKNVESWKERYSQLCYCCALLLSQDLCLMYKSWICPALEYEHILYSGVASSHLQCLDTLQTWIERTCCLTFQSLLHCCNAAIMELVCHLLAGEGWGNLQDYCLQFCVICNTRHRSSCLHVWDPAAHLHFIYLVTLKHWTDIGIHSWQVSAVHLWNSLPADILLTGATLLKCSVMYFDYYMMLRMYKRSITIKIPDTTDTSKLTSILILVLVSVHH